jgi:hypothetical protein
MSTSTYRKSAFYPIYRQNTLFLENFINNL